MVKKIAVLPGDGIGPEIIEEALRVLGSVEKNSNVNSNLHLEISVLLQLKKQEIHYQRKQLKFV